MMYARTPLVVFAALLVCLPAVASADEAASLQPGSKVRVKVASKEDPLIGQVLALDDESLTLAVGRRAKSLEVRRREIRALDVSDGRHSRRRNAMWGALVGGGVGAVVVASTADSDSMIGPGIGALFGVVLGAPIGAGVGAAVPRGERWKSVPLDRLRVAPDPPPVSGVGRIGVSASLSF